MLRFDLSAVAAVWPCWCRALLLIVTWKKRRQSEAERSSDGSGIRTHALLGAVGAYLGKACVNTVPVFSQLPSFYRKKKPRFLLNRYGLFPPHKMAAVLSAAWQSRSVLWAWRDGGSLWVCPVPYTPQRRARLALVMVRNPASLQWMANSHVG